MGLWAKHGTNRTISGCPNIECKIAHTPCWPTGVSKRRAPKNAPKARKSKKTISNSDLADTARAAHHTGDSDPDDEPAQHRSDRPAGGYGRAKASPLAGLAAGVMIDPVTMQPLDPAAAARKRRKR